MAKTNQKTLSTKQADTLRERIKTVVTAHKHASIEVCRAVWEADTTMVRVDGELRFCWEVWGHKSFEDFLGKEMHLHLKTASGFKRVWDVFYVDLQGAWNTNLLLGITKMRLLTSVKLTPKNVESWLRRADGMNCRELQAAVFGTEELYQFATALTGSQMTIVKNTLDRAKSTVNRGEKMSRGDLLVHIMRAWRDANKTQLRSVA